MYQDKISKYYHWVGIHNPEEKTLCLWPQYLTVSFNPFLIIVFISHLYCNCDNALTFRPHTTVHTMNLQNTLNVQLQFTFKNAQL